jgi:acetyl esterase/lipase
MRSTALFARNSMFFYQVNDDFGKIESGILIVAARPCNLNHPSQQESHMSSFHYGRHLTHLSWWLALAIAVVFSVPGLLKAEVHMTTYTYKEVGELKIKADVYTSGERSPRPVLVWIHGGALIMGHREGIDQRLKQAFIDKGYAVVSIDYRLAPETQLPQIINDVEDAFRWIRDKGPELFDADPRAIAVSGGSAGGYLTLVTGYRVKPRPVALVAFWGYGGLVGSWYSEPSPHPRHHEKKLTREQAFDQVSGAPISDARDRKGDGGGFYQFCRQQGLWPKAVSGWDPKSESEKFSPFMPVKNVSPDYPPTLLIHGEIDTDVPHEESVNMATELKRNKVEHRLISVAGGEHGLPGMDRKIIDENYRQAIEFIDQHVENALKK